MKKMYYEICSCNPANGGNGICGCTMGNRLVDTENTYTTITTTTTGALIDKIKPQMKQTAVEWLMDQLGIDGGTMRDKALTMEQEQIELAFDEGSECEYQYHINGDYRKEASTYYNETYGGDNV